MDNPTAAAVIRLQLDDIENLLQGHGTEAEGTIDSDARLALQLYQKDIKAREAVLQDRRIACSIGAAVASDGDLIQEAQRQEYLRSRIQRLEGLDSGQRNSHIAPERPPRDRETVNDALASLNRVHQIPTDYVFPVTRGVSGVGNTEPKGLQSGNSANHQLQPSLDSEKRGTQLETSSGSGQPEQSSLRSTIKENAILGSLIPPTTPTTIENAQPKQDLTTSVSTANEIAVALTICTSCEDEVSSKDMIHTTCGHSFCLECLTPYVQMSFRPGSTFPPSCCDLPLTLAMIQDHVSLDVMRQYTAKQDEIASTNSLQCAQPSCKTLIPLENIKESEGKCALCHKSTCRNCKRVWHGSNVCEEGKEREKIVKLAKKKGWQFCFRCRNCVGISYGCNHIMSVQWSKTSRDARLNGHRCLCKAEFCYVCGVKWRHCDCPRWDEDLLLGRAERALRRRRRLGNLDGNRPEDVQLAEMQNMLRVDCNHPGWVYKKHTRENPGVCRLCGYQGWQFILRCYRCGRTQCLDCARTFTAEENIGCELFKISFQQARSNGPRWSL